MMPLLSYFDSRNCGNSKIRYDDDSVYELTFHIQSHPGGL
jgi:hypothetical protein